MNTHKLREVGLRVADHVTAMLAYWDRNLMCRFANAAYVDWFGKTRDEMVDKINLKDLLGPDLYAKNLKYISGALLGREQVFEREIPTPSGELRYSLATYIPDISDGEVIGFFVHVADISGVKKLEKKLQQTNAIVSMQNKRLLNFANVVSHNLVTYSRNFKDILRLLEEPGSGNQDAFLMEKLRTISEAFSFTVENLKDIVQVQNLNCLKREKVKVYKYVNKVITILGTQIESSEAKIINRIDHDLSVPVIPAYLESILLNLISNAIKYRHPERPATVTVSAVVRGDTVCISVSDNGRGIDLKKYGSQLFQLYKTFHDVPDAKGLGLYITRFQAESLGGRVEVKSEVDEGSVFKVYLPLKHF